MKMEKQHYYESWRISDKFWDVIKDEIPVHRREEGRVYQRKPGGGRKVPNMRRIAEGIFYVLRTGCLWKAIPEKYGKGSNIHRYFQLWEADGFFERIWATGLEKYDEGKGIDWEWQSIDGCMTKAPLAQESVGKNPTDRGKKGNQTQPSRRRERVANRDRDFRSKHS